MVELLVGMIIMLIISGLSLNAIVSAGQDFNASRRDGDRRQKLTSALEFVGNDIKDAGKFITDPLFPVIEFRPIVASDTIPVVGGGLMAGSSIVTIRTGLVAPLTLCQTLTGSPAALTVGFYGANYTGDPVGTPIENCGGWDLGSIAAIVGGAPATSAKLPVIDDLTAFRCQRNSAMFSYAGVNCNSRSLPVLSADKLIAPIAITDGLGRIKTAIVNQETRFVTAGSIPVPLCGIGYCLVDTLNIANDDLSGNVSTLSTDLRGNSGAYTHGKLIYPIQTRTYRLGADAKLYLQIDNQPPAVLLSKIQQFNVSAKQYKNTIDKTINTALTVPDTSTSPVTPAAALAGVVPIGDLCAGNPSVPTVTDPPYVCKFNMFDPTDITSIGKNWQLLAGVKVRIQSQYEATGKSAVANATDTAKLVTQAEFYPRNAGSR